MSTVFKVFKFLAMKHGGLSPPNFCLGRVTAPLLHHLGVMYRTSSAEKLNPGKKFRLERDSNP